MDPIVVLLVDDEVEFITTLAERLELRGFQVMLAFSGEEAVAMLAAHDIHVMVLDLKMPGMSGMEVLLYTKKHAPRVKTIMLTGHGSETDEHEARQLGVFDYLNKPIDINSLHSLLDEAARRRAEDLG